MSIAARIGDGDPSGKSRLRSAEQIAWLVHLFESKIVRAIQKNFGEAGRRIIKKSFTKPAHPTASPHPYNAPEDHDNTQNVYFNLEFPEESLLRFAA